jgi:hypothetical protein
MTAPSPSGSLDGPLRCVCGCGQPAVQRHHCVTRSTIRKQGRTKAERIALERDERNLAPIAASCHYDHHAHARKLPASVLPDSVFVFAAELMGPGAAFEWLIRHYEGQDPRLDALLATWEEEAA